MELQVQKRESVTQSNVTHVRIQMYNTITTNLVSNCQNLAKNNKQLLRLVEVLRENAKQAQIARKDFIAKMIGV